MKREAPRLAILLFVVSGLVWPVTGDSAAPIELYALPQEFCSTKGSSLDKAMNLPGDTCCLEMDLTVN